ncbi:MAG TPA: hypothetical protein VJ045_08200 [Hyphomicrobiaceae bacterium]|nr:hypothetical protein [Hyphomicrobiaceae bacterium]
MTSVAHESVAAARLEIEAVARRLLALRSGIDEILVGLVRHQTAAPAGQAESAGEPVEEPMTASATPEACTSDSISLVRNDLTLVSASPSALSIGESESASRVCLQ